MKISNFNAALRDKLKITLSFKYNNQRENSEIDNTLQLSMHSLIN